MKKYISLLFVLPFLAACEKNIKVKLPDYEEQLFFFSNAETGNNFSAFVRRSEKITNYNNLHDLSIKNATIMLYINDDSGTPVYYIDSAERYLCSVIIKQGDKLRIEVMAPDFPKLEASAEVPAEVPINEVSIRRSVKTDGYGNPASEVKIRFADPGTTGDYYLLDLTSGAGTTSNFEGDSSYMGPWTGEWVCVQSTDPSIDEVTGNDPLSAGEQQCLPSTGILLNDQLFNGQTKELTLYANDYFFQPYVDSTTGITSYPKVQLKHISAEYYRYLKTTKNVLDNSGNPFAEPVNVKSNIKNGYGVLAPVSVSIKEIKNP